MLSRTEFADRFGRPALFGMVHLLPLPGSPLWRGSMDEVADRALMDAATLEQAGFDGVVVENFGDLPFSKTVDPETVAAMSVVIARIVSSFDLKVGVNVLRNDAHAALAIASATGASFIRVNVHVGTMATDQGLIDGEAAGTLRSRRSMGAEGIAIFADLLVKHAEPLVEIDPLHAARELRERGLADAVLITGRATGAAADMEIVRRLRSELDAPMVVASGVSEENAKELSTLVDGLIIGTSIKQNGETVAPVDLERARRMVSLVK